MLVSLRKYLYSPQAADGGDAGDAGEAGHAAGAELGQAFALVTRGIVHALAPNLLLEGHADLKKIRQELHGLEERLGAADSSAAVEQIGQEVTRQIETYRAKMLELEQEHAAQIHNMISSLNQTVVALSGGSQRSIAGLQQIEKELVRADAIEDIVAMRSRLATCLNLVREETARERTEVARNLLLMQEALARAEESVDLVRSGLPDRSAAERALKNRPEGGGFLYAALFVLDRFATIGARFGADAAEQAMDGFIDCLRHRIAAPRQLFRWSEPAVLAVLERKGARWEVAAELQSVDWGALEKRLEAGERVAVLSLKNQWAVFEVDEAGNLQKLSAQIDQFAGRKE